MKERINFIDVGCADYLIEPWSKYTKNINFILGFDVHGIKEYKRQLLREKINHKIYQKLIFTEPLDKILVCKKKQNSSLFKVDTNLMKEYVRKSGKGEYRYKQREFDFRSKRTKKVKCVRLDETIDKMGINFDFIKIDTQGSEYQVLKSLGEYLKTQIIGVYAELFFKPLYREIILYQDVDKYLRSCGFHQVIKVDHSEWVQDFLYIRNDKLKKTKIEFIKKIYEV